MFKVGPLDIYLSLKTDHLKDISLLIGQNHYIKRIAELHSVLDSKAAQVPWKSFFTSLTQCADKPQTMYLYAKLLGMEPNQTYSLGVTHFGN